MVRALFEVQYDSYFNYEKPQVDGMRLLAETQHFGSYENEPYHSLQNVVQIAHLTSTEVGKATSVQRPVD